MATKTKRCFRCKEKKANTEFRSRSSATDGLHSWCRRCENAYRRQKGYDKKRHSRPNGKLCPICNAPVKGAAKQYCSPICKGKGLQKIQVGDVFGELTVIAQKGKGKNKSSLCFCTCSCGAKKWIMSHNLRNGSTKACGNKTIHWNGKNSPRWRGGTTIHHCGYKMFKCPGHPNARKDSYIMEHIFVMSEHLGRPLRKEETVHHKNGIRSDNRLQNLELWSFRHPPGHRVSDMLQFCREYLSDYASFDELKGVI